MAVRDHTVRTRPSVPPDGTLTSPPGYLRHVGATWPSSVHPSLRADIALALLTLNRLRYDSERCHKARALGFPVRSRLWRLSEVESDRLGMAIHHLQDYARRLGHESEVNVPPDR